jgi:hypothetical protein
MGRQPRNHDMLLHTCSYHLPSWLNFRHRYFLCVYTINHVYGAIMMPALLEWQTSRTNSFVWLAMLHPWHVFMFLDFLVQALPLRLLSVCYAMRVAAYLWMSVLPICKLTAAVSPGACAYGGAWAWGAEGAAYQMIAGLHAFAACSLPSNALMVQADSTPVAEHPAPHCDPAALASTYSTLVAYLRTVLSMSLAGDLSPPPRCAAWVGGGPGQELPLELCACLQVMIFACILTPPIDLSYPSPSFPPSQFVSFLRAIGTEFPFGPSRTACLQVEAFLTLVLGLCLPLYFANILDLHTR